MREQDLPDPGGVQRKPGPGATHDGHRGDAREPVEVEGPVAVALSEVDGRAGDGLQVLQERRGHLAEAGLHRCEEAEVPQPAPDDVRRVVSALECSAVDEAADDAERRRWGEAAA